MQDDKRITSPEAYGSYGEFFDAFRSLAQRYGDLPAESVMAAYGRAAAWTNPFVQNNRVKRISSFPVQYTKDQIVKMLQAPNGNEVQLRQVSHALEWTAYPYFKIRKTYQAINTYRYFTYPLYLDGTEDKNSLLREWRLLDKFNRRLRPDMCAHKIVGQAIQEGKVCKNHIGVGGTAVGTGGGTVDGHIPCAPGQREGQTGGGVVHVNAHGHGHLTGTVGGYRGPGFHIGGTAFGINRCG